MQNTKENEFQQISRQGFMKHNGGLLFLKVSDLEYQFKATIEEYHLNPGGSTHGGFIMSLMDSGMGTAAHRALGPEARAVTIAFDVKFISSSTCGDTLLGTARVIKRTRSLVFMQGELKVGARTVATAEGIWKVL